MSAHVYSNGENMVIRYVEMVTYYYFLHTRCHFCLYISPV